MQPETEVWVALRYTPHGKAHTLDGKPVGDGKLFALKMTNERRFRDGLIQRKFVPIEDCI